MWSKIRKFIAKLIYPEAFIDRDFWKEGAKGNDEGLIGYATIARLKSKTD